MGRVGLAWFQGRMSLRSKDPKKFFQKKFESLRNPLYFAEVPRETKEQFLNFKERMEQYRKNRPTKEDKDRLYESKLGEIPIKYHSFFKRVPTIHRELMISAFTNKTSAKKAIKAKCLECSNYQKYEINKCDVRCCPLWSIRPYQNIVIKQE